MFTNFGMIFQRFSELTLGGGGEGEEGEGVKNYGKSAIIGSGGS